ncbi:MAG: hypothetical protein ACXWKU_20620 [Caulobacteraceae bacterium]
MPATQAQTPYPAFTFYAGGLNAADRYLAHWQKMVRTATDFTWWWTERWLEAPSLYAGWAAKAAQAPAPAAAKTMAAVIDLAEAAAARTAQTAAETVETVTQAPFVVLEETAAVVETVAEQVAEAVEVMAEELTPEPDDLTLLVGIGPKLAAALAERGVTRFVHLAAWTEDDLGAFDKALDLKGRAVRDAWVAQARRFAAL